MNILINLQTNQMEWTLPEGTFQEKINMNRRRFILEAVHEELKGMDNDELRKVVRLIQEYRLDSGDTGGA